MSEEATMDAVAAVDWESRARDAGRFAGDRAWLARLRARHELVRRADAPSLAARLEGAGPWTRAFILETLAWIRDPASRAVACRWSARGEPRPVRSAAIRLLGALEVRDRLREILGEPLERVSPYEVGTDWIHEQARYALEGPPRDPLWNSAVWDTARVGAPAPDIGVRFGGRSVVLVFLLADW